LCLNNLSNPNIKRIKVLEKFMISGGFILVSSIINAHSAKKNREMQEAEMIRAQARHEQDQKKIQERFEKDLNFRKEHFLFTQSEAEKAVVRRNQERLEDWLRQDKRDAVQRSFEHTRRAFLASPDGWYLHDPFGKSNSGIKSLRVLFQSAGGPLEKFYTDIELEIIDAIKQYKQLEKGYPIHFPTGIWNKNQSAGSYVSSELYALNQEIPTMAFRFVKSSDGELYIQTDIFGFLMGDTEFEDNIKLGPLPNDMKQVSQLLSLLILATADIYFVYEHAKKPLLPQMLSQYQSLNTNIYMNEILNGIFIGYQTMINAMLLENPQVGLYAAVNLAETFAELPDKSYAKRQLHQIVSLSGDLLFSSSELNETIQNLYRKVGEPKKALYLAKAKFDHSQKSQPSSEGYNLESLL
jgi:hypothetical protein